MKIILGLLLCLCFCGFVAGQTPRVSDPLKPGKIGVIIYAPSPADASQKQASYTIFLDGAEIATARPGRYFMAAVSPGAHILQIGESGARKLELEIKAPQLYYLRVNESPADYESKDFEMLPYDKARPEMKDFKMIDNADVKDSQIAINWQEG